MNITFHSLSGGTGKTSILANLALTLAKRGKRVLILDYDLKNPTLHKLFGLEHNFRKSINAFLRKTCSVVDCVIDISERCKIRRGKLFLIPASASFNDILFTLTKSVDLNEFCSALRKLAVTFKVDFIFIDTHSGIDEDSLFALAISDRIYSVWRFTEVQPKVQMLNKELERRMNKSFKIIINMVPLDFEQAVLEKQLIKQFGQRSFDFIGSSKKCLNERIAPQGSFLVIPIDSLADKLLKRE
jgi:MinD-like ATPase involved in chromosome partitioning or flagellar assembly